MLPGGHKKAIGNDKAVAKDEAARSSTFYERFMTDDPDAIVWVGMDEEEPDEEDEEYAK